MNFKCEICEDLGYVTVLLIDDIESDDEIETFDLNLLLDKYGKKSLCPYCQCEN